MRNKFSKFLIFVLVSIVFVNTKINAVTAGDVMPATTTVKFYFHNTYRPQLLNAVTKTGANIAYDNNYRGQNIYVVNIDTGIESVHPFFGNRIALEACFAVRCPNGQTSMIGPGASAPVHWHGTHTAGIAAGFSSSIKGIAPSTKIISINVFGPDGSAYDSDLIKALQWVDSISSQYSIAAINMSLGTPGVFKSSCNSYLPELTFIIGKLKANNIATVVSAGNEGQRGMSSPACITDTVSVTATYTIADGTDRVTSFGNVNEFTDFSAPGLNIISSKLLGSYSAASGTSMSAPIVTGAFAVYRSKYGVQSVDKIVSDFQSTAVNAKDDYTGIVTKRIDFKSLFSNNGSVPSPTTTIPTQTTIPTTTTIPAPTTTTIPSDNEEDELEDYLNIPYIISLNKYYSKLSYIKLDFTYRYTNIRVSHFILKCRYNDGLVVERKINNRNRPTNSYLVSISSINIRSCKMAAVSFDNVVGPYTKYILVK